MIQKSIADAIGMGCTEMGYEPVNITTTDIIRNGIQPERLANFLACANTLYIQNYGHNGLRDHRQRLLNGIWNDLVELHAGLDGDGI